tara:strand:- start:7172 stop:7768 length:597 start_codon:yes stop_codon:yes gene_type:complete
MGIFRDCGCGCDGKKQEKKLAISFMAALTFFIIANPSMYRLMRRILGKWVSGPTGCPSSSGLLLHTVVFMFVTWGMMNIKYEGFEVKGSVEEPAPEVESEEEEPEEEVPMEEVEPVEEPVTEDEEEEDVSMMPMAPPRMAEVESPLPGMAEAPIGLYDTGMVFSPMDINEDADAPASIEFGAGRLSVSCADGSRPIVN